MAGSRGRPSLCFSALAAVACCGYNQRRGAVRGCPKKKEAKTRTSERCGGATENDERVGETCTTPLSHSRLLFFVEDRTGLYSWRDCKSSWYTKLYMYQLI